MTYNEKTGLVGCRVDQARTQVAVRALDRKKSHDGQTRIKLDLLWTALFIAKLRETEPELDRAIGDLRRTHADMMRQQPTTRSA